MFAGTRWVHSFGRVDGEFHRPRAGPARAGRPCKERTNSVHKPLWLPQSINPLVLRGRCLELPMLPMNRRASIVGPALALLTASLLIGAQGFNSEPLQQLDTKTIAVPNDSAPTTPAFSRTDPAMVDEEDGRLEDVDRTTAGSISPHGGDFRSAIAALSSGAPRRDAAQDEKQRSRGLVSVSGSTIGAPIPQGNPILQCLFVN
jgi:hypothetical protein